MLYLWCVVVETLHRFVVCSVDIVWWSECRHVPLIDLFVCWNIFLLTEGDAGNNSKGWQIFPYKRLAQLNPVGRFCHTNTCCYRYRLLTCQPVLPHWHQLVWTHGTQNWKVGWYFNLGRSEKRQSRGKKSTNTITLAWSTQTAVLTFVIHYLDSILQNLENEYKLPQSMGVDKSEFWFHANLAE